KTHALIDFQVPLIPSEPPRWAKRANGLGAKKWRTVESYSAKDWISRELSLVPFGRASSRSIFVDESTIGAGGARGAMGFIVADERHRGAPECARPSEDHDRCGE